jgi:ribosome maturation factor RimP
VIESDYDKSLKDTILEDLEPVVTGLGFSIVELKIGWTKKETHITVVIHGSHGVGINDCSLVARTIQPRFEFFDEIENLVLRVTSPGIDRVIKDKREYSIFINRGIKVLLSDAKDWVGGIIKETDETGFILQRKTDRMKIVYTSIRKAKLDYTEEVEDK